MKSVPLQMVVVELDNGRRGVFFGTPFLGETEMGQREVENVWFSPVRRLPDEGSLEALSAMALAGFDSREGGPAKH